MDFQASLWFLPSSYDRDMNDFNKSKSSDFPQEKQNYNGGNRMIWVNLAVWDVTLAAMLLFQNSLSTRLLAFNFG